MESADVLYASSFIQEGEQSDVCPLRVPAWTATLSQPVPAEEVYVYAAALNPASALAAYKVCEMNWRMGNYGKANEFGRRAVRLLAQRPEPTTASNRLSTGLNLPRFAVTRL